MDFLELLAVWFFVLEVVFSFGTDALFIFNGILFSLLSAHLTPQLGLLFSDFSLDLLASLDFVFGDSSFEDFLNVRRMVSSKVVALFGLKLFLKEYFL